MGRSRRPGCSGCLQENPREARGASSKVRRCNCSVVDESRSSLAGLAARCVSFYSSTANASIAPCPPPRHTALAHQLPAQAPLAAEKPPSPDVECTPLPARRARASQLPGARSLDGRSGHRSTLVSHAPASGSLPDTHWLPVTHRLLPLIQPTRISLRVSQGHGDLRSQVRPRSLRGGRADWRHPSRASLSPGAGG